MLPKISIITPTYNQFKYIETTIQSVIKQSYPNYEYIIIDGGSDDGTLEIIKNYQDYLTLISEKDNGQVDAINKGIKLSTGEIIAYLNSDDLYLPFAIETIGKFFEKHYNAQIVTGRCINIDSNGNELRSFVKYYKNFWQFLNNDNYLKILNYISQPATFWRRNLTDQIGYFNPDYRFAMDYDYWLRISSKYKIFFIKDYLAKFRVYSTSISGSDPLNQFKEEIKVASKYSGAFYRTAHRIHAYISYSLYWLEKKINKNCI